jgi:hypothetical protein
MAYCLSRPDAIHSRKKLRKKTKSSKKDIALLGPVSDRLSLKMSSNFQFGMKSKVNNIEPMICKTPTRQNYQTNFSIPVNKIDLMANNGSTRPKDRRRSMSRNGRMPSFAKQRSASEGSNYDSDFSANVGGITLANQREITEDEFYDIQDECMNLIRTANDTIASQ